MDVFQTTSPQLISAVLAEGYAADYVISSETQQTPGSFESGLSYSYGLAPKGIYFYNTDLVTPEQAELLQNYEGLGDPALADLNVALTPMPDSSGAMLFFYILHKVLGVEAWESIAALNPTYLGATPAVDAVSRGEVAVAVVSEGAAYRVWQAGAPVQWTLPEPTLSEDYPQIVVENTPHPNAARLFQEFVMSKPGQEIYSQMAYPSRRIDVPDLRTDLIAETGTPTSPT